MKKRFMKGNLVLAIDTTPRMRHHEVLRNSIVELTKMNANRNSITLTTMIAKKRQQLVEEEDRPLTKRIVSLHSRDWSWHIGWSGWFRFDWNISWIATKFGKTVNPDGLKGMPTYNRYEGILGKHCDL